MFVLPLQDPILILALLLVILLLIPILAKALKLPVLVLLILTGMVLGTNVLGILQRDSQLILLEKFGLLYIMLLAGVQMDLSNLRRLGQRSLIFGLLTFSVPLLTGLCIGKILDYSWITACIIGLIYSPHVLIAYPIVARLGLAQTESVGVTVGATVVTSFLTLASFSIIQASALGTLSPLFGIKILLGLPALIMLSIWSIPKIGQLFIPEKPQPENSSDLIPQFVFVLATLFVLSGFTSLLGIDAIVGAFIAGLALNPLIPLRSNLMQHIDFVGNSLFIPSFMVSVGVLCNPQVFLDNPDILGLTVLIYGSSMIGKAVPAAIATRLFQYRWEEGMILFSLTFSRAALVVVVALFAQQYHLISENLFNVFIAYILLTCLTGPILTEWIAPKLLTNPRPAS